MTDEEFVEAYDKGWDDGAADGFWYGVAGGVVVTSIAGSILLWLL
jgi:hypothetical protein